MANVIDIIKSSSIEDEMYIKNLDDALRKVDNVNEVNDSISPLILALILQKKKTIQLILKYGGMMREDIIDNLPNDIKEIFI